MGAEIRWDALEAVAELIGVDDVEMLLQGLTQIREHMRALAKAESEARR
jgi:hypothetical protein